MFDGSTSVYGCSREEEFPRPGNIVDKPLLKFSPSYLDKPILILRDPYATWEDVRDFIDEKKLTYHRGLVTKEQNDIFTMR